jgi:extradiol dioxygenase family protein
MPYFKCSFWSVSVNPSFHLSIGVKSIEESADFFVQILKAKVVHRDPSGYVNIDFFGTQITLKANPNINPNLEDFHFGVNLSLKEFDDLSQNILKNGRNFVEVEPEIWDAGTPLERKKMYLKCPTGYLVELKGYK